MDEGRRQGRWVRVLLVAVPVWLLVSGGIALWLGLRADRERAQAEVAGYGGAIDAASLADDVRKLVEVIGRRGSGDGVGQRGLERAAAMIEGGLGAGNAGYRVTRLPGPDVGGKSWPLLEVTAGGRKRPGVWVVAAYDTRGNGVETNATGVAAVLAAARALAGGGLEREVRMLFVPHGFEPDGPARRAAAAVDERIRGEGGAWQVLCVEGMGTGAPLRVSCPAAGMPVGGAMANLGQVVEAAEVGATVDGDLPAALFALRQPVARVATQPLAAGGEAASGRAEAPVLAAATGRLVELVRRLAGSAGR